MGLFTFIKNLFSKVEAIESQVDSFVKEVETKGGAAVKEVVAEVKATEAKVKKATKEAKAKVEAVEAKVAGKCGCGRSETGKCVGLHKISKSDICRSRLPSLNSALS